MNRPRVRGLDAIKGLTRLTRDATRQVTDVVEAMHLNIARPPWLTGKRAEGSAPGIAGLVYHEVRTISGWVHNGIDLALEQMIHEPGSEPGPEGAEIAQSILNGVLGDYLEASDNPLALKMRFRVDGRDLPPDSDAIRESLPDAGGRLLIAVHGSCMNDRQWNRQGHDHGVSLAADHDYALVRLLYNSGRHVSANGREFSHLLQELVQAWPVPVTDLVVLCHSMGGLVTRSACYYAAESSHTWTDPLRKILFLGTPHHGAPLEKGGNWVDFLLGVSSYSAPLRKLGEVRSAGVTDLRYGYLLDDDWEGRDRFEKSVDDRIPVPLPDGVACYAFAASMSKEPGLVGDRLVGDGLVTVPSALGQHANSEYQLEFAEGRTETGYGMNHFDLLNRPEVYAKLNDWITEAI